MTDGRQVNHGAAARPGSLVADPAPFAPRLRPAPASPPPAPVAPLPPRPPARPPIVQDPSILGLSRHARGRLGSRLFTLFFVLVFGLIVVQLVVVLLHP